MNNLIRIALVSAALGGCATAWKDKTTSISVTSATPGATVLVDGKPAGQTPTTVELSNKSNAVITVQRGDHHEECRMTTSASVTWIVADVFLTSGLGLLVDWGTHNWNELGPKVCQTSV